MTFSATSFSVRSAAVRPVPLMGPDRTTTPVPSVRVERNSSGLALATSTP